MREAEHLENASRTAGEQPGAAGGAGAPGLGDAAAHRGAPATEALRRDLRSRTLLERPRFHTLNQLSSEKNILSSGLEYLVVSLHVS